jgi:hypothetical protein
VGGSKTAPIAVGVMKTGLGFEFRTEMVNAGDTTFTGSEGMSGIL